MKNTRILMIFLVIALIVGLFTGCIPTIPSNSSNLEGESSSEADIVKASTKIPFNSEDKGEFSDYWWEAINVYEGPGPNYYSSSIENVWLDEQDRLHLKIVYNENTDRWECASVVSIKDGWGYGKYTFEIDDVIMETENKNGKVSYKHGLDENVVIGLYTYDGSNTSHKSHNEIDIEFAKWGDKNAKIGNFVVWYDADNLMRNFHIFSFQQLVRNSSVHSFEWNEEGIQFDSTGINKLLDYPSDDFTYKVGDDIVWPGGDEDEYIPEPKNEKVCMNIWLIKRKDGSSGEPFNIAGNKKMKSAEVIISNFEFTPSGNWSPDVHSITADPDNLDVGENSIITCDASDPDGDTLSYDWSSPEGGIISGSGESVTWTAPSTAGLYPVICTVSDGKGGSAEAYVNIEVTDPALGLPIKIFLQSSSILNGILIDTSDPSLSVSAGANVSGTLLIEVQRPNTSPGNVVPVGYTSSWGTHSSSYTTVASSTPGGTVSYSVPINFSAPSTPGTYYLIFSSRPEMNLGWVMSQTNWTMGSMSWNDGYDIADVTEPQAVDALTTGYLILGMLEGGIYKPTYYGITYVKIIVE